MSHLGYLRDRAQRANRPAARVFSARYGGRCALCPDPIDVGDDVTYVDDEVAHVACPGPSEES